MHIGTVFPHPWGEWDFGLFDEVCGGYFNTESEAKTALMLEARRVLFGLGPVS